MLYYETVEIDKNKDWVVFIHGLGGSLLTWKKQIEPFSKEYNLLLIDLNGHGKSYEICFCKPKDYMEICNNIKEILDNLSIEKAHFVGLSLGTFVLVSYATMYSNTVKKLVMGGGVIKLERSKILLIDFVQCIKRLIPCGMLYSIFSYIIMPKKNHAKSRKIFNREALKIKRKEFLAWLSSLSQIKDGDKYIEAMNKLKHIKILYVMGKEDHMFLNGTKSAVEKLKNAKLYIIENSGHVCTIEKYKEFNETALAFLDGLN